MLDYNLVSDESVVINDKEFRVTVTGVAKSGTYLVGVREYITTERYTGFSAKNGVTVNIGTDLTKAESVKTALVQALALAK